jgi:signal transduction histidine kinase
MDWNFAAIQAAPSDPGGYVITYQVYGQTVILTGLLLLALTVYRLWVSLDERARLMARPAGVMLLGVGLLLLRPLSGVVGEPWGLLFILPYNSLALGLASFMMAGIILQTQLFNPLQQLNHALEARNRELAEANLAKDRFLATMSHELRTPLGAIIGYTDLLKDGVYGPVTEQQVHRLERTLYNAQHLLQLINDILDLSKIGSGTLETQLEAQNLLPLLENALASVAPQAASQGLRLQTEVPLAPVWAAVDARRFGQVLLNLLSNAIKFTPTQGEVCLKLELIGPVARISVRDTGIGLPPDQLEKIFEAFYQVDNSSTRQYQGTGLGLAISRKLAELHGGRLWAENNPEGGSCFFLELPQAPPPQA